MSGCGTKILKHLIVAVLPLPAYETSPICLPLAVGSSTDRIYIVVGLAVTSAAFMISSSAYVAINFLIARSPNSDSRTRAENVKILQRTLVLVATNCVSWLPTLVLGLVALGNIDGRRPLLTLAHAKLALVVGAPLNALLNPIIYIFSTRIWRDVRRAGAIPFLERLAKTEHSRK